jgi:hypothetical protein
MEILNDITQEEKERFIELNKVSEGSKKFQILF